MYIVPTIPHLRGLRLTVEYRELPEEGTPPQKWHQVQKWKTDPDASRYYGYAPGNKHYVNGELVAEDGPGFTTVSRTPFPENRVPRRGLVAVTPDDPAYADLCREQGLGHLIGESPLLTNGLGIRSPSAAPVINGLGSPTSLPATTSGHSHGNQPLSPTSESGLAHARPLVNGVNGVDKDDDKD